MNQRNHSHGEAQQQAPRVSHINLCGRVVEYQKSHNRAQDTGRHSHCSEVPGQSKNNDVEHSPDRGNTTGKTIHSIHQINCIAEAYDPQNSQRMGPESVELFCHRCPCDGENSEAEPAYSNAQCSNNLDNKLKPCPQVVEIVSKSHQRDNQEAYAHQKVGILGQVVQLLDMEHMAAHNIDKGGGGKAYKDSNSTDPRHLVRVDLAGIHKVVPFVFMRKPYQKRCGNTVYEEGENKDNCEYQQLEHN